MFRPRIDIRDHETAITITVELPGINQHDIDISLSRDTLCIKGEKKQSTDQNTYSSHYTECAYGSFQRIVSLPVHVDGEKAKASFKNGILTITLPKEKQEFITRKKIPIRKT